VINDRVSEYVVRGTYPDANGNEAAIVMDISAAQHALSRFGRVDRLLLKTPNAPDVSVWEQRIRAALPAGLDVRPQGTETVQNRQMLAAFRWNLRLLSYISLVVGAFLIYNAISVSVVRRRAEIGIARALGASRAAVLGAFLGEAAAFGVIGAALSLPAGRLMAIGAVRVMSGTVQSLYVSSRPGAIVLNAGYVALAFVVGVGVALLSAFSPAREAAFVAPVQAMARGRREYEARVKKGRDLAMAAGLAVAAVVASRAPAIAGKPVLGYGAALLLVAAAALAIPAFVAAITGVSSRWLGRRFGAEALLASRSLGASLRRTSVLVAALATAIATMVSIGIMVGSFRETVVLWMEQQLPADLYIRPAGETAADRHPTLDLELADAIATLPGVAGMDRLRAYEIRYQGKPVMLGGADFSLRGTRGRAEFFSGRPGSEVLPQLRDTNNVVVSEPFLNKHGARVGDAITLSLGAAQAAFRIIDAYYDYSSERGEILMDRVTLLRYLPDPAPSNVAVYVAPGFGVEQVRSQILQAAAGRRIAIFSDGEIRAEAIRIFDRTFAITYALEAIAVLVAVMGVAGALLALVMDRRRELGLLRFLGAASRQIRKLIVVEAALLGLLATFAGALLGYFLSLILIFVINKQSFGWTIQFHWPVTVLVGAMTMVFTATVIAGLYPARMAVRMNPLEVIHED
jgi:putative ABC transport system permease protein